MTRQTILKEAAKLSLDEQLQLVEDLWDHIACDSQKIPVPPSHLQEIKRRLQLDLDDPKAAVPWDRIKDRYTPGE